MKVTAAVTEAQGAAFQLQEVDMEDPHPDEVVVRLMAAGICHSDLSVRDGVVPMPLPMVLGHEGAGVVASVGSAVTELAPGDKVVLTYLSCGQCPNCAAGHQAYCLNLAALNSGMRPDGTTGLSRDGVPLFGHFFGQSSFATHSLAHRRNCVKLDPDIDLTLAPAFACGVLTGAGAVLNGFKPDAGTSIAILGTGTVGIAALLAARLSGCATIIAVDLRASRLELASDLGATHTINAGEGGLVGRIRDIAPTGVDFAVETTGSAEVTAAAIDSLAAGGHIALLGLGPIDTVISFSQFQLAMTALHIHGYPSGLSVPNVTIPRLVSLYKQGRFPIDRLITTFPFKEIDHAADQAARGDVIKPVLLFDDVT